MPPVTEAPEALESSRLISSDQVRRLLGNIGKTTLYAYLKNKKDPIPSVKIHGKRLFQLDQVLWWIKKHEQA